MQKKLRLVVALACSGVFSLVGCTKASQTELDKNDLSSMSQAELNQQLNEQAQQIRELAKQSQQCVKASDCKVVPVGARACGGPDWYMAISEQSANSEVTLDKVKQYTNTKQQFNKKFDVRSICVMEPEPEVMCQQQQCTLSTKKTDAM